MFRVLHLVEYLTQGGIERLLEQLARHTPPSRAALSFFSYETGPDGGIGRQMSELGVSLHFHKKRPGHDGSLVQALARVIRDERIDVLHTHDFGPMEYAIELKLRFPKLKLVHTQHTLHYFLARRRYVIFFQIASLFYREVLCVSEFVRDTLSRRCPLSRSKLSVAFNGVDLSTFRPAHTEEDGLAKSPGHVPLRIVSVARISPEKNLTQIAEACGELARAGVPFEWHHAGTGPDVDARMLKETVVSFGIQAQVHLHGFLADVRPLLEKSDVFVSSSRTEGLPVAVLEAMACEKACVLSDIPSHRELGVAGIVLFPLDQPHALSDALKRLASARPECIALGKHARTAVASRFSMPAMIDRYLETYA